LGLDDTDAGDKAAGATATFRLTPDQIVNAARAASAQARARGRTPEDVDFQAGARAQSAVALDRLARHVEPTAGWLDLVLPWSTARQLHEIAARTRLRETVFGTWQMQSGARGHGVTALFAGESGTGKTLAAEVVAHDLGLDLYVIDLAAVVDKYIGETEKNLDRIFTAADHVNGVLLFDEADAIFGKRSEVRDAHDRYANVEIAYLLQRIERFDGLAILTTNFRANVDDAFTRRLDAVVDFPLPEVDARSRLYSLHLRGDAPRSGDIDLDFMAHAFELAGGSIRNICVTAAFFAAEADRPLMMVDLVRATEREYRKLGRLCLEDEFGEFFDLLAS
jgi:hypothetical protein